MRCVIGALRLQRRRSDDIATKLIVLFKVLLVIFTFTYADLTFGFFVTKMFDVHSSDVLPEADVYQLFLIPSQSDADISMLVRQQDFCLHFLDSMLK